MEILVSHLKMQVGVKGHADDRSACGAVTMLMRASSMCSEKSYFEPGVSMIQFKPDFEADFFALVYGLECIAAKEGWSFQRVSQLDGTEQIAQEF